MAFIRGAQNGWFGDNVVTIAGRNFPVPILVGASRVIAIVALGGSWLYDTRRADKEEAEAAAGPPKVVDPFAGGYPVPPLPGQTLKEPDATTRRRRRPHRRHVRCRPAYRGGAPWLTTRRGATSRSPKALSLALRAARSDTEGGSPTPAKRVPPRAPARPTPAERRSEDEPGFVQSLFAPVAGFGVTFGTMFRKVVTEEYPEEKRPTEPRFHGRHQLNRHPDGLEKCIGCELCAWACPADAIYVEGAANDDTEGGTGASRPASATAASTRSTTCAASSAACASRPARPGP